LLNRLTSETGWGFLGVKEKMKKLSLCIIAGNVEKYISRFLDSFEPLADEIIVVRAIGNQEPDQTLQIAEDRGCRVSEYRNFMQEWPHVDDFAAARNQSFSLASHDLIMWADTDDVISPESIAAIRDAIERMPNDCVGLEIPYNVPEDGLTVFRERIIRKGTATWRSPIHEHLAFHAEPQLARITNAHILHMPSGPRSENNERNLRILESIPSEDRTGSHRFHLFQSLRAVGRMEDAMTEVCNILRDAPEDIGTAEKYELFIAAGQLTQDPSQRSQMMLQALATDPSRREAYGELANCMVALARPEDALAYTRAMRSIPRPSDAEWNLRSKYYGYLGESLHGMALRVNGYQSEADAIETNHFIRSGAKISLLHATRGRVPQAVKARQTWLNRAANPDAIEHIFGLDASDPSGVFLAIHNHALVAGNDGPVAAWNAAAAKSKGQILVQMSDDFDPPMHWDKLILDAIGDASKPAVLAVSDGHRTDNLLCMAILTRARYKQQGYMFHPEFFSMHSDNWFSERAFENGIVIDARDKIIFEHLHPAFGKAEMDETYARSNAGYHYQTGDGMANRLRAGIKTASDIPGWFDFRDTYALIAQSLNDGDYFAEVGSWKGKSLVHLAQRIQDLGKSVKITAVDSFQGDAETGLESIRKEFDENLRAAKIADMVNVVECDSTTAASLFPDGHFSAVFIDAAHNYESAKADIKSWLPKIKAGGIFAGHDIDSDGVSRALSDLNINYKTLGRCWIATNEKK